MATGTSLLMSRIYEILRDVLIRTQRAVVASRRASNLATHPSTLATHPF
jgi:hypothetical protein